MSCPETFYKGVAISVWQNSGDDTSNWAKYVKGRWPFSYCGTKSYRGRHDVKSGPDFWNRYKDDIECAHRLGCTGFRLSIEWSRIEPVQGQYDESAVQRYHDILDVMEKYKIEPMATLHHFVHPSWFDDIGGFEQEANISIFVKWAVKAFDLFGHRIKLWGTFNEPTCAMFLGWITGFHPPGKLCNFLTAGWVLLHMLRAHTAAYHAIKAMPGGDKALIGLVHHHIRFEPRGTGPLYFAAKYMSKWLTFWWGYDVVHQWLTTGRFEWEVPVLGKCIWWSENVKPPMDWFGINYYSRAVLAWHLNPTVFSGEVMTDMYYPIYSTGLYRCITQAKEYGVPVYITETGITTQNEEHRALMINSYMDQILRAVAEGHDVRGVYYWTLIDNFEWSFGFDMKFGLYAYDPPNGRPRDRTLKEGAKALSKYYKTLPDTMAELRVKAAAMPFAELDAARQQLRAAVEEDEARGVHEPLVPTAMPA